MGANVGHAVDDYLPVWHLGLAVEHAKQLHHVSRSAHTLGDVVLVQLLAAAELAHDHFDPLRTRVVAETAGVRRGSVEDLAAESSRERTIFVHVDVIHRREIAAGVEVDQYLRAGKQVVDDCPGELLSEDAIGIARENPVQVRHVERCVTGQRLKRIDIGDRDRDDTAL